MRKTKLLNHILGIKYNLCCMVIVTDMVSINIDAGCLAARQEAHQVPKWVNLLHLMHGDLFKEIAHLAKLWSV